MLNVVLYQPKIPPNTGNIVRLCANSGFHLHLIHPLGFSFDDKKLVRAGLDYHEFASVFHHDSYQCFTKTLTKKNSVYAVTTKGKVNYASVKFKKGDCLLFGSETQGLPLSIHQSIDDGAKITIPMLKNSRSLNLSNAVAIVSFEAWRQLQFSIDE